MRRALSLAVAVALAALAVRCSFTGNGPPSTVWVDDVELCLER